MRARCMGGRDQGCEWWRGGLLGWWVSGRVGPLEGRFQGSGFGSSSSNSRSDGAMKVALVSVCGWIGYVRRGKGEDEMTMQ